MSVEKTVFISYRRSVGWSIARLIFQNLRDHDFDVFMDVESINSGQFDTIILNQIAARAHFLVILTPGSVERCTEPGDWLRREIEHAMDLQRNIVPVLVNNFSFTGMESCLTGKLSALSRYNGLNLPPDYFEEAMERLRSRFLKQPVYGTIQPTPPAERAEVQRKVDEVVRQPALTPDALTAEQHLDRGNECFHKKDCEGAVAHYTQAIRLNSQYATAYSSRGEAYFVLEQFEHALADFQQANELKPNFNVALAGLAITHHVLDNVREAKRLWRILISLDGNYRNAEWVRTELNWADPLANEARKLIARLWTVLTSPT